MRAVICTSLAAALFSGNVSAFAAVPMRISTIDAQTIDGNLQAITPAGMIRLTDAQGQVTELALSAVLRLIPRTTPEFKPSTKTSRTIYLADGGVLTGHLMEAGREVRRALRVDVGHDLLIDIPFDAIAAIRLASDQVREVETKFKERLADRRPGRDIMIVAKGSRAAVVTGSLERLGPRGWEFAFGSRSRSAGLDKAYGFILGATAREEKPLPATILMHNGNRFTARIKSGNEAACVVDAAAIGPVTLPWSLIRRVDILSERVVYLSDLDPASEASDSMIGSVWNMRRDRNVGGGPLRLGGVTYPRGLGVHANSVIEYSLDGQFERFSAIIGIDDGVGGRGSVVFRVSGDGRKLYESKTLRGDDGPETISVDVRAIRNLILECRMADNLDISDHGNWANAMLIRAEGQPKS